MGGALYRALAATHPHLPVRTYAPVGEKRELLAYLVRRLLENSASTSYVRQAARAKRSDDLLRTGFEFLDAGPRPLDIPLPTELHMPQRRIAKGGREIELSKFRTMAVVEDAGAGWATHHVSRITVVGRWLRKYRLDEIPQVFAVFRGDMSFVGPRPERPFFVQQLKTQIPFYGLREAVKPGITGWAQIRYSYGSSVEDACAKLEYDLYYVQHQSLFLDLAICFHTVKIVLFGRGAR